MSHAKQTTTIDTQPRAANDIEAGEFASTVDAPSVRTKLVVATYNIRYAVGSLLITGSLFRRLGLGRPARRPALVGGNIERAARAFRGWRRMPPVDVLALQEADRLTERAGRWHVARELATALKMNYVRAAMPTPDEEDHKKKQWYLDFEERINRGEEGDTGVAILSRLPLAGASRVELPWAECPWRPRLAMTASVPFAGRRLHVFNAHIDPHAPLPEQIKQHEAVLDRADAMGEGEPVVFVGDFNTLIPRARDAAREYLESRGFTTPMRSGTGTWRAGPLRLHADWIFVRGVRVARWGVARGLRVSDHWPVWAELEADEGHEG